MIVISESAKHFTNFNLEFVLYIDLTTAISFNNLKDSRSSADDE